MPLGVFAEQRIVSAKVTLTTTNDSVTASIEGGNEFKLNCIEGQSISQNLSVVKEVSCTSGNMSNCDQQFSQFVTSFDAFKNAYNQSIEDTFKNCNEAKALNSAKVNELLSMNQSLTDCQQNLEYLLQNSEENKTPFYNLYIQEKSSNEACQQKQQPNCISEVNAAEQKKTVWGIGGAILGAIICYFVMRSREAKTPLEEMPGR